MTTSGTVGTTVVNTTQLIEHAVRRCGLSPASITAETLQICRENLYLLMLALANRGLNLWCVVYDYIGLAANQATYQLPVGTISLLEMYYATPSRAMGTDTAGANSFTTDLGGTDRIIRFGLKFESIPASDTITVEYSPDNLVWTTSAVLTRTDWTPGAWYWLQAEPAAQGQYFRIVATTGPITVEEFYLANSVFDLKVAQYNRDEYFSLPNRQTPGRPSTNYYYERLLRPQVTLWPVPNNNFDHLVTVRHRQIQDVGALTQELEVPERWREAIIWQLADRLGFELPGVTPDRVQMIAERMRETYSDVGMEETDGSSLHLQPMLRVYTR